MNPNARNTDPETSHEVSKRVNRQRDKALALRLFLKILDATGENGLTNNEFREHLANMDYSFGRSESLRRRLTDLKESGELMTNGQKRDGSAVLVPVKAA